MSHPHDRLLKRQKWFLKKAPKLPSFRFKVHGIEWGGGRFWIVRPPVLFVKFGASVERKPTYYVSKWL